MYDITRYIIRPFLIGFLIQLIYYCLIYVIYRTWRKEKIYNADVNWTAVISGIIASLLLLLTY